MTQQLREEANLALELAQARYKLGLGTIVEFSQAELQRTDAESKDTDAHYGTRDSDRARLSDGINSLRQRSHIRTKTYAG